MDSGSQRLGRRLGVATMAVLALLGAFSCVNRDDKSAAPAHSGARSLRPSPRPIPQTNPAPIPSEVRSLMRQATEAVNARDADTLKSVTTSASLPALAWVRSKTTKRWNGDVLVLPAALRSAVGAAARAAPSPDGTALKTASRPSSKPSSIVTYLAVFHAWHTCESDGDHIHVIERASGGWRIGAEIPETETGGYRVRDHVLNAVFDVPKQAVTLQDQARVEAEGSPLLPVCLLRMSEDFRVTTFTLNGQPAPFQQAGGVLAFVPPALNGSRTNGENSGGTSSFLVGLTYAGRVNHQGSDYILANEATLDSYWYPHIARLPATSTVTATAPPGWLVVAQGEKRQERQNADGSQTVTYRNDVPNSFFTLDIGRYTVTRRVVNGRTLSAYLLTPNETRAAKCLDVLAQSLAFYDTHFAPFPYTHYEVVETKGPFGGALEAYSFATFGPGTLPNTIAHELAHTWWGGLVPCTYTRSMWNEGFAEYASGLFSRVTHKPEEPLEGVEEAPIAGKRRNFGKAFDTVTLAQAHDTSDAHDEAVGYGKGALVLRALEAQLGQETLLRCLQTFVKDHRRGEAAEWPEFARAVSKTTGQDYGWFFAQWTERVGLPQVRLENVVARRDAQGFVIQGVIVQEGEPYRLHLPLRLQAGQGKPLHQTLDVDGPRTAFELHSLSAPLRLTLDPDNALPLATTTDQATFGF